MITIQLPNTNPMVVVSGAATKAASPSIPSPLLIPTNDVDLCDFESGYIELVFGQPVSDPLPVELYKNDFSSFLFRKLTPTDTVTIKLFKNGVELATIVDDTYGVFFPNLSPEQPLYTGFIIEFQKVINVSGGGRYEVITDTVIVGVSQTITSQTFQLVPFDTELADGTIRIETIQDGNIIRSQFDYTGLEWPQSFRTNGFFGDLQREFETDQYENQNRKRKQIQDRIIHNYDLRIDFIPSLISKQIMDDQLLANVIKVTDYNILNDDIYREIELYPASIETTNYETNTQSKYLIKFTDKVNDLLKRNK